jgi:23S rRNA (adenine2503-C2)-methyltransferase
MTALSDSVNTEGTHSEGAASVSDHLLDALDRQLNHWLEVRGAASYRRGQIRRWLFERRAADWEVMSDLPQKLRRELTENLPLWRTQTLRHTKAEDGTEKLLLALAHGGQIECVLLRDRLRRTICISTQVGCGMGCVFCASGLDGALRNLSTGEIVEQMLRLQQLLGTEERLSHVVVMGMGEPLANLDALLPALAEAHRADGLGISTRRITISTVGLPAAIDRLAGRQPHYRLALSLHAPNDALRRQLVPAGQSLQSLLAAADRYFSVSGRRMTFEYVLLAGINDQPEHARQLALLLGRREALLNIIPYNPVAGLPYQTPSTASQQTFQRILTSSGLRVKFRHRKGKRIDAACGQLRREHGQQRVNRKGRRT